MDLKEAHMRPEQADALPKRRTGIVSIRLLEGEEREEARRFLSRFPEIGRQRKEPGSAR